MDWKDLIDLMVKLVEVIDWSKSLIWLKFKKWLRMLKRLVQLKWIKWLHGFLWWAQLKCRLERREDSHFARNLYPKSSGQLLYIYFEFFKNSSSDCDKIMKDCKYLGVSRPKCKQKYFLKNVATGNFRLFCLTLCIWCSFLL